MNARIYSFISKEDEKVATIINSLYLSAKDNEKICSHKIEHDEYECTRILGHIGMHVAHGTTSVCAIWRNEND